MKPQRGNDWPRVAIIGAGISGIAMAVRLVQAGMTNFEIFDSDDGLGGTWRVNNYPGCSVDVPSPLYQYSFNNVNWKRTHPNHDEILEYLVETSEKFGLNGHYRFNTEVKAVRWDERIHRYRLSTAAGDESEYDIVVSSVGFLVEPNIPAWPGLEDFKGIKFHTARWDHDVDLTNKRVAVVGVGSTSVQIVPSIQPTVKHLYVFQREPGWVVPRNGRDYSEGELRTYSSALRRRLRRLNMLLQTEARYIGGPHYIEGCRRNRRLEQAALEYIHTVFKDRPDLKDAVTPRYPYSGKRRVLSDTFYPTLLKDNVELVARPVAKVTANGLVDDHGNEYPVDVLIISTGFTTSQYLARLQVYGRNGQEIHNVWKDEPYALLGLTVPGFPNFYMMYGPNTNGSGAPGFHWIAQQEASAIVRDLRRMARRGYTALQAKPYYAQAYNDWMQRRLKRTTWNSSNNYTKNKAGRIVTQIHMTATLRWLLLRLLPPLASYGRKLVTSKPDKKNAAWKKIDWS